MKRLSKLSIFEEISFCPPIIISTPLIRLRRRGQGGGVYAHTQVRGTIPGTKRTGAPAVFGLRSTVPCTKSSVAFRILITLSNSGLGLETQYIGCTSRQILRYWKASLFTQSPTGYLELLFLTLFYSNIYIIQQIFEAFSSTVIRYCPLLKLFSLTEKIFGENLFGGGSRQGRPSWL